VIAPLAVIGGLHSGRAVPLPEETHVVIRPLRRRDLRSVLRIEQQVYPRPWTAAVFRSELSHGPDRCYLAATVGTRLVGYAGEFLVLEDAHVTNVAVDPRWQRHGIGSRLLLALTRVAVARGAKHLTLEVRASNTAAQAVYRRFGMAPVGVRRKYYENVDDALVMWVNDIDGPEHQARLDAVAAGLRGSTTEEWQT
jgi:ribosomal-protein-alanine N-acetyltransferase